MSKWNFLIYNSIQYHMYKYKNNRVQFQSQKLDCCWNTNKQTNRLQGEREGRQSDLLHSLTWTVLTLCLLGCLCTHPYLCPRWTPVSECDVATARPRWLKSPPAAPPSGPTHHRLTENLIPTCGNSSQAGCVLVTVPFFLFLFSFLFCSALRLELTKPHLTEVQPPTWRQQLFWQKIKLLMY